MSFEVIVFAMRFNSCLVERVSAMTIFVPSDRTTRSKGVINSANGRLNGISAGSCASFWLECTHARDSIIKKAI